MKKFMILDTETTGLPEKKAHPNETEKFPYIVQLSYIIFSHEIVNGSIEIIKKVDHIIRVPDEVIISEEVVNIHGISNEISRKKGVYIESVLPEFIKNAREVDQLIAHNAVFDLRVIRAELHRMLNKCRPSNRSHDKLTEDIDFIRNTPKIHCTMMTNIKFCNIKKMNKYGYEFTKFPKLGELHQKIFDFMPNNLHNSLCDVIICMRCFIKRIYDVDIFETNNKTIQHLKSLVL